LARGLDEQDLGFDLLDSVNQHPPRRFDVCGRPALQHRAQRFGQQLPEDLLGRRGGGRALSLPARHMAQYLRAKAGEVEQSLGEIGGVGRVP
jgi:hypothetical protein